jgi:hypothetical protein
MCRFGRFIKAHHRIREEGQQWRLSKVQFTASVVVAAVMGLFDLAAVIGHIHLG